MEYAFEEINYMVRSHIQMPRFILANFQDKNNALYYFDVQNLIVSLGHAKSFYTEYGYYDDDTEKELSEKEGRIGKIVSYLKKCNGSIDYNELPNDYIEIIYEYVLLLVSRSPDMINSYPDSCSFRSYVAKNGARIASERRLLKEYAIKFLFNNTKELFLLPMMGMVQLSNCTLLCPVTPYRAIVLYIDGTCENRNSEENINDSEIVRNINIEIIRQESQNNGKYIVSSSKDYLCDLLKQLDIPYDRVRA